MAWVHRSAHLKAFALKLYLQYRMKMIFQRSLLSIILSLGFEYACGETAHNLSDLCVGLQSPAKMPRWKTCWPVYVTTRSPNAHLEIRRENVWLKKQPRLYLRLSVPPSVLQVVFWALNYMKFCAYITRGVAWSCCSSKGSLSHASSISI